MIGDIRKFRFWCQKVLPLVYDDSLSYYEVLCKVVNYLNHVIEDVNSIPTYIDSEIDEKLSDEHLQELIEQFVLNIESAISSNNEGDNTNSSADYNIGQMLWWNGKLYKVIRQIDAGDTFIVDTNIELVNFEDLFNDFLAEVKDDITSNDDGGSPTATQSWTAGTWLWLNDVLYKVKTNITQGNAYVFSGDNANVEQITVEGEIDGILNDIDNEAQAREDADDALAGDIGDLNDLTTVDKNSLVEAINEVNSTGGGAKELVEPLIIPYIEGTFDDVEVGKFIYTHGYYSAYDGGGGFYQRVSSPINNVTYDHNDAYYKPIPVNGFVNVKQFGVKGGNNDDTTVWTDNKTIIENVISASVYEGLIIPSDVNYGYNSHATNRNVLNLSTSTIRLMIYDYSNDDSYYPDQPDTIKASVCRILMHTPDADGDGKHDGNGLHIIGNTNPYLALVNDGTTGAETRRAGVFWGSRDYTDHNHVYNWQMSQGYLATDKDLHINKIYYDTALGAITTYNYITFRYDKANNTHNMVFGNTNAAYFPFHLQGIHPAVVQDNATDSNLFEYFDKYPSPTMRINFQYRTTKEMRINNEVGAQVILDFSNADANKISTMFKYGVGGGAYASNQRPAGTLIKTGAMIFDTTLNKPIWFNGTNWVDATGTTV